jgi:hypothetical protein
MALLGTGSIRWVLEPGGAGRGWLAALAWLLLAGPAATAQIPLAHEYQIKAVFLFNFAQFVDWPPQAFAGTQSPLVIGVLGEDRFGTYLDEVVRSETVNNRPLVVERFQRTEDIRECQVLFISDSEAGRLDQILAGLKGRSILTVSDTDGFSRSGGMIRFVTENNRIRLRINLAAARSAGLTISSKLLRPAEIVTPGKDSR